MARGRSRHGPSALLYPSSRLPLPLSTPPFQVDVAAVLPSLALSLARARSRALSLSLSRALSLSHTHTPRRTGYTRRTSRGAGPLAPPEPRRSTQAAIQGGMALQSSRVALQLSTRMNGFTIESLYRGCKATANQLRI